MRGFPDSCGQHGQFIPVRQHKVERLAAGDPRPSIAERYENHSMEYVREVVNQAARRLVKEGFLLEEDKERLIEEAEAKGVELWKSP